MLGTLLKENTRQPHQALEKTLVEKIKKIKKKGDYTFILKSFYGFIKPLEESIEKSGVAKILSDYSARRKADWILMDLSSLNEENKNIPMCDNLSVVGNTSQAIGALYVLEGSTLGGQIIKKMVEERLPETENKGLQFFNGYGDRNPEMWERFQKILNSAALDNREVITAASETFTAFKNWIIKNDKKEL